MKKEVAKILLKVKAITLSPDKPYKFVSGILSPIYCDNRLLMSYPKERKKIVDFFIKTIKENKLKFDLIGGIATSGICWASWIAEKLDKPMIYIRGKTKEHGKENLVEGKLEKGQKVLIIEDLISTGGSSLTAIQGVREQGGVIEDCVAIFTYEMEKAVNGFKDVNVNLFTLSDFTNLIEVASKENYIKEEDKEKVLEWNKNPGEWNTQ